MGNGVHAELGKLLLTVMTNVFKTI